MSGDAIPAGDRELWQRAQDGDAGARQQLVERAWQLSQRRLRSFRREEREEIEQGIAAAVLRAVASGVQPESNLDGLLEWRARAEITAFVRRRVRERRFEHVGDVLECAGHDPAPFERVATDELRQQLQDCIERIPNDDQRAAVGHRFVAGLSPAEIATVQAARPPVVRVWIARGAALVRACLEQKFQKARGA